MTVSTTSNKITYAGNGATTSFPFNFPGVDDGDLVVTYVDVAGNSTVINHSQLTIVLTTPVAPNPTGIGGTVTYPLSGSPIAANTSITIERVLPVTQDISLANQGTLWQTVVEQSLDYLTMLLQQQQSQSQRAYTIPATDPSTIVTEVPTYTARALQMFGWDASGNPIAAQPSSALVSAAMAPVVAAASIAAAVALLGINTTGTTYADRAALAAAIVDPGVSVVTTAAYASALPGIGGASFYRVAASVTGAVQSADGQWWAMSPTIGSPDQMGAKGDGAINAGTGSVSGTDDTVAIQNSIDYFAVCQFQRSNKIYRVSKVLSQWCINVTTSNHIVQGNGCTLALSDGTFTLGINKIILSFTGVNAGNRLSNIHVESLNTYGNGTNQGAVDATNEYSGIQLIWCDSWTVTRCFVSKVCGDALGFGGSVNGRVIGNRVQYSGKDNIYLPAGTASIMAIGNNCFNPNWNFGGGASPFFGGTAYACIAIDGDSQMALGNTCACNNSGNGIIVSAVGADNPIRNTVVGNTISGPLGVGIALAATPANATTAVHCTIEANVITGAASNGIEVTWTSQFSIVGNTVQGCTGFGVLLNGRCVDFTMVGNVFKTNTLSGIGLYGARNGLIGNNVCNNNTVFGIAFGNSEALGVNANQNIDIGENQLLSNGSGDIDLANLKAFSTATKLTYSAAFTWDPANTADGAMVGNPASVSIAGVVTTSQVLGVSFNKVVTANWILSGNVTGVDTVTISGLNKTGGAVDLASGVGVVVVKFT